MPITTKHHAQSNSNPGLKSDYMARTLTRSHALSSLSSFFKSLSQLTCSQSPCSLPASALLALLTWYPQPLCSADACQSIISDNLGCYDLVCLSLWANLHRDMRISEQTCPETCERLCASLRFFSITLPAHLLSESLLTLCANLHRGL